MFYESNATGVIKHASRKREMSLNGKNCVQITATSSLHNSKSALYLLLLFIIIFFYSAQVVRSCVYLGVYQCPLFISHELLLFELIQGSPTNPFCVLTVCAPSLKFI